MWFFYKIWYLVLKLKMDRFSRFKESDPPEINRRNTSAYFEDWNLSLLHKLGKIAVFVQALFIGSEEWIL
ncbi:hypothetical protein C6A37_06255 [Desulfobacteraceae bacterium SEEP-SAG9]|nr:hypothetical protein C6A37_06255 [Desulfobacteraceae bacterium SEEP-SAG9]